MICWSADSNFSHSDAAVKSSMSKVSVAAAVTAPVAVDTRCGPSTVEEAEEVDAMVGEVVGHPVTSFSNKYFHKLHETVTVHYTQYLAFAFKCFC